MSKKHNNTDNMEADTAVEMNIENVIEDGSEKKKFVLSTAAIICFVCALVLCIVPFTPFMSEIDVHLHYLDGEYIRETEIAEFIYMISGFHTSSFSAIVMSVMAYVPFAVAVLIVLATVIKKNFLRYIMMAASVGTVVYWMVAGNMIVAKIFEGELYEPAAGYYMLLGASFIPVIINLVSLTKEKNQVNSEKQ